MKISWNLRTSLTIVTLVACLLIALIVAAELPRRALATTRVLHVVEAVAAKSNSPVKANALNPNPPQEVEKLVFIHHSCGRNWLDDGHGDLGAALGANNYYVSDTYYDWGPDDVDVGWGTIGDHTDIGHWYNWFAGPNRDTYLSALYTTTNQNATYTRLMPDPGSENEIIMFKSCYPNSNLKGNPDDPPTVGDNPLRGLSSSSEHHTVGNAKGIYNDILEYFGTRQDKLFVVIAAPPVPDETYADNARALNNWLVDDWLADYPYHNVAVFDFYNVLTTNGGDYDTNDYGLPTGNHHRVVTTTSPITIEHITDGDDDGSPNVLEYPSWGVNEHPSPAGNQKATGEFIPLLNIFYNCWEHGDCGVDAADWISVTAVTDAASIYPGETVTFTLSVTASEGFTTPVDLALQGAPSGATLSFVPNPITPPGTSHLHITTTSSTTVGIYPMVVTGTSGLVTDTTSITLTIKPKLTLTAQPVANTVLPGDLATYSLTVSASRGFTAPVALASQGAPSGTVLSFVPNPITPPGVSHLHITTSAGTTAGIYPMTVAGTAGALSDTTNLTLIVASEAPSFTLSISPTTRIAKPSQIVSYTTVISGVNGFSQPVTLVAAGLPPGIDTGWSTNPVTPGGSSILTGSVPSNLAFGEYPFYVVGTVQSQAVSKGVELIIDYPFQIHLPLILK